MTNSWIFSLYSLVEILEFVQGGEALDVQAVGQDHVGLAAEQFLGFAGR